jgi:hypothetical protein
MNAGHAVAGVLICVQLVLVSREVAPLRAWDAMMSIHVGVRR